jgi:hypothetical protein
VKFAIIWAFNRWCDRCKTFPPASIEKAGYRVMAKTAKYPHRIEFRATVEEYQRAEQLAIQSDVTVSDLLRVLLRQAEPADSTRTKQLIKLYQKLGFISKHLSQLSTAQDSTPFDGAVELIDEARRLIVQSIH